MKFKIALYYGIATLVSVLWAIGYVVSLYRHEQPSPMLHSMMIAIVAHFFTRAKAGPQIEREMKDQIEQRNRESTDK